MIQTNEAIAEALEKLGLLLDERGENPHRVKAYLTAAESVRHTERPLAELLREGGIKALKALPGIGDSIALRIAGYLETGRLQLMEQIRQEYSPEMVFTRVTGIGPELARRIHDELGVETLEELEMAAYDGRLEKVAGFGARRIQAIRTQLNTMLSRAARRHLRRLRHAARQSDTRRSLLPTVDDLLNVDLEYRARAERNQLPKVAPRRFNPTGEAWLPILHTQRGAWLYTALYSNTPTAHELGKTHDWVVLYFERDGREYPCTVVTETRGPLKGRRVVRGREAECLAYYNTQTPRAA